MSAATMCDREGCGNTGSNGLGFHVELAPFALGGGRRLHDFERHLDFCSAGCLILWAQPHAERELERREYVERVLTGGDE